MTIITDSKVHLIEKRIADVVAIRNNSKSDWAINYWDNVLAYLLRQANRLH